MKERIQKILSGAGVASRRQAETMISQGRIKINDVVAHLGDSADTAIDSIYVDGRLIDNNTSKIVIALNKPKGYVSTMHDEHGRKTVYDLLAGCSTRVYSIGRLDMYSEGLLLFTNDGELANKLSHPSGSKKKIYIVEVGNWYQGACDNLRKPMVLDGYRIQPVEIQVLSENHNCARLRFCLKEGRNRQIRKMCQQCGLTVLSLRRIEYGGIALGDLPVGKWRELSESEIQILTRSSI